MPFDSELVMNHIPANPARQAAISADEDSLANGEFLTCCSKIADPAPIDTKLGSTILMQLNRDPGGQISSASFGISRSGDLAIDVSHTSGRLIVNPTVTSPRKREEAGTKRHLASKAIGE